MHMWEDLSTSALLQLPQALLGRASAAAQEQLVRSPDACALAKGHVHVFEQAGQHALLPVPRRKLVAWPEGSGEGQAGGEAGFGEGMRSEAAGKAMPVQNSAWGASLPRQATLQSHVKIERPPSAAHPPMTGLRLNRSLMLACRKPFSLPLPITATWETNRGREGARVRGEGRLRGCRCCAGCSRTVQVPEVLEESAGLHLYIGSAHLSVRAGPAQLSAEAAPNSAQTHVSPLQQQGPHLVNHRCLLALQLGALAGACGEGRCAK